MGADDPGAVSVCQLGRAHCRCGRDCACASSKLLREVCTRCGGGYDDQAAPRTLCWAERDTPWSDRRRHCRSVRTPGSFRQGWRGPRHCAARRLRAALRRRPASRVVPAPAWGAAPDRIRGHAVEYSRGGRRGAYRCLEGGHTCIPGRCCDTYTSAHAHTSDTVRTHRILLQCDDRIPLAHHLAPVPRVERPPLRARRVPRPARRYILARSDALGPRPPYAPPP
jgi:hypothetical protein